jgi:multicomponent Na+:H+ antiporter subunit D
MGRFYLLAALAVIVSIITLASFLKFQRYAFFNKSDAKRDKVKEVPFPMIFSMVVLSVLCLILSLLIIPEIREAILTPAVHILTDPLKYTTTIIGQ